MPTYEYVCTKGHEFEKFQKMSDKPTAKCPECGAKSERRISGGQGFLFKGSGFYITDYGKDGKGARKAEKEGGEAAAKADAPAKPDAPAKAEPPAKESGKKGKASENKAVA